MRSKLARLLPPDIRTCSAKREVGNSESNTPEVKPSVSHAAALLLLPARWKHAKPNNWQHNASKQPSNYKINVQAVQAATHTGQPAAKHRQSTPPTHCKAGKQAASDNVSGTTGDTSAKQTVSALTAKQRSKQ